MKARKILEALSSVEYATGTTEVKRREQVHVQYLVNGNVYSPLGIVNTIPVLEAGIYDITYKGGAIVYETHDLKTDELLRFEDKRYTTVLNEISKFWDLKSSFSDMGFTHKRGILLFGVPGSGKSCLTKLVMEDTIKKGDVVFIAKSSDALSSGLANFREVEPDRRCLVVIEDIDELVKYNERPILELFDGDSQVDNVVFLATTNYMDRLAPRMLRRFDRKLEIKNPPKEGRLAYLKYKLGLHERDSKIEALAEKTKGLSFAQLREFLVGTYCLGDSEEDTLKRIFLNLEESKISEEEVDAKLDKALGLSNRVSNLFERAGYSFLREVL